MLLQKLKGGKFSKNRKQRNQEAINVYANLYLIRFSEKKK